MMFVSLVPAVVATILRNHCILGYFILIPVNDFVCLFHVAVSFGTSDIYNTEFISNVFLYVFSTYMCMNWKELTYLSTFSIHK